MYRQGAGVLDLFPTVADRPQGRIEQEVMQQEDPELGASPYVILYSPCNNGLHDIYIYVYIYIYI